MNWDSVDLLSDNSLEETPTDISSNVFHSKLFQVSQANS